MISRILIFMMFLSLQLLSQNYKSLADTSFVVEDLIKPPSIYFNLSGGGGVHYSTMDSVKAVADFLKKHYNLTIELGIHSDHRDAEDRNIWLTKRRADTLKSLLVRTFEIPASRLTTRGYGESKPLFPKAQIDTLPPVQQERLNALNRRLELKIIKIE